MRPINATTLSITITLILAGFSGSLALKGWWGPSLIWVIAAAALLVTAVLIFLFCWVLPRLLGGERSSEDEGEGAPANRLGNLDVRANLRRKSSGGIDLNASASISTGAEVVDDEETDEDGA